MRSGRRAFVVVLGVIASGAAACATIAGADSKEVDVCFEGCDGGPGPATTSDAERDPPLDDGGCNCPAGMQRINGVCVMTASPVTHLQCNAPLQLPSCEISLELDLCDTAPKFHFDPACSGVSGGEERPAVFIRLGKSRTGRFETRARGPYIQSVTSASCDRGVAPCANNANPNTIFRSGDAPSNVTFAFGKRNGDGCDRLQISVTYN